MRNIISLHIGQSGVQIGHSIWQQLCQEHLIDSNGHLATQNNNDGIETMFMETGDGNYRPRAVFIDAEPTVIDQLFSNHQQSRLNSHRHLYSKNQTVCGKQSCGSIFSRGAVCFKDTQYKAEQIIRKQGQKCDRVEGIMFTHSANGGCGAGLGSVMMQRMSVQYGKVTKYNFPIFPSQNMSNSPIQVYNAVLSLYRMMEHNDITIPFTNERIYRYLEQVIDLDASTYANVNQIISQAFCSLTASLRLKETQVIGDMRDFVTNTVPYPRIHYLSTAYSSLYPLDSLKQIYYSYDNLKSSSMLNEVFRQENWLATQKNTSYYGKFMSNALFLRGEDWDIHNYEQQLNIKRKNLNIEDWVPCPFKTFYNKKLSNARNHTFQRAPKTMTLFTNSSAITRLFQSIDYKFDLMYAKRAFVHWYVGDGFEEGQFSQARQNSAALEKDYETWMLPYDFQEEYDEQ